MHNLNPFSNNRAEYMKELWRYYVPNTQIDFTTCQPLYIEGGRGTGKTTLFLCNCWREKYSKNKSDGGNGIDSIFKDGYVGLYYKVDPVFVSAMQGNGRNNEFWSGLFCTYLSIEIVKELFEFLLRTEKCGKLTKEDIRNISEKYYKSVRGLEHTMSYDIVELLSDCEEVLDEIENSINSMTYNSKKVRKTMPGTIVNQIINQISYIDIFENITFKIFIDEYESLKKWQQKLVNTLIKRSNNKIVYNIGVKPKGMKTFDTIAENETLQKTHDYQSFYLDAIIAEGYDEMLKKICEKRLVLFKEEFQEQIKENISTDIEDYLGRYSVEKELERFIGKKKPKFYQKLEELIRLECDDENIIRSLCTDAQPAEARLHLALLLRNKKYKPSVKELYECYTDWLTDKNTKNRAKYREWHHNTQSGVVFLLAKDYHTRKWYYGFDTYVLLSSGIVRFFLELCEQVFNIAIQNGFEWCSVTQIAPEIQTRAANYVSKRQIMEIESYGEYGKQMTIFTNYLGTLFRELHRNDNLTLGEPEPNHFSTNVMELEKEVRESLDNAIRCSVLQELPQTKDKELIRNNAVDYHLNKIFAPYFEISYYRKRKLDLSNEFVTALLSSNQEKAGLEVKAYLKKYWNGKNTPLDDSDNQSIDDFQQLSFFDGRN